MSDKNLNNSVDKLKIDKSKMDKLKGSIVALVTPMNSVGKLDEKRLEKLIALHLEEGTQGFVLGGTTGEAPTLTEQEREKIISIAVKTINNKVPIILGTGTYNTHESIEQSKRAESLGVDACLVVTPYYNRPTQEGMYLHFSAIANAVKLPIIMYNVPTRTASDLLPETVAKLAKIENIVGIKEATGDLTRCQTLSNLCGKSFKLFSGCDDSALAFMLQGGHGVISVTANVAPKLMKEMCEAALARDLHRAGSLNKTLMPLHKSLFVETNPIPVKWAVAELGLIEHNIRLPLTILSSNNQKMVREAMQESGVFNSGVIK